MFWKMEKLMVREIKSFWDKNTLTEYLALKRIPNGLQIKTFPTYELTDESLKNDGQML